MDFKKFASDAGTFFNRAKQVPLDYIMVVCRLEVESGRGHNFVGVAHQQKAE